MSLVKYQIHQEKVYKWTEGETGEDGGKILRFQKNPETRRQGLSLLTIFVNSQLVCLPHLMNHMFT